MAYNRLMDPYNKPMTDEELLALSESKFTRQVNEALKTLEKRSFLELSRSPLAHASLVTPALILDDLAPTPDDRGRALRVVLRWAVNRLAPMPPRYPLGTRRPFEDPTWQDPLWWPYNILRHRYLEPLDADQREVLCSEGEGYVEALLALTGIPSTSQYYAERERAIEDVARLLARQLRTHHADEELRHIALDEIYAELQANPAALAVMELAATFRDAFPRALLLEMAKVEVADATSGHHTIIATLHYLQKQRLLQQGDNGTRLWMSPPLQAYLHAHLARTQQIRRHRRALLHYRRHGAPLEIAWHLQMADHAEEAATLLLQAAPQLIGELQSPELRDMLATFTLQHLPQPLWYQVQRLRCDVHQQLGERQEALAACHNALKAATQLSARSNLARAQVYRRLGKLHEDHNQGHALEYYRRAIENFTPADTELVDALKDRAWVYIHRKEWAQAEADLNRALALARDGAWRQQADIHTAMASIHRQHKCYTEALAHARKALTLREERGDFQSQAEAWCNVGLIHTQMGEINTAMGVFHDALTKFEELGCREAIAIVKLNMGVTLQLAQRLEEAITYYKACLDIVTALRIPLLQSKACSNLVETYAALEDYETAHHYWQRGHQLNREAGLEKELEVYDELLEEFPRLKVETSPNPMVPTAQVERTSQSASRLLETQQPLAPEEIEALKLAQAEGRITNRALREATGISKPTATRKLSHLVELDLLRQQGQGRGTHYVCKDAQDV
jgi:tetratricopeptide (TPR) repeat protein